MSKLDLDMQYKAETGKKRPRAALEHVSPELKEYIEWLEEEKEDLYEIRRKLSFIMNSARKERYEQAKNSRQSNNRNS